MKLSFTVFASLQICAQASRERITEFVENQQIFFVESSSEGLYLVEDPNVPALSLNQWITWICSPTTSKDNNKDGQYDNVVAHAISFYVPFEGHPFTQEPQGYVATWNHGEENYYESLVDYADTSKSEFHDHQSGDPNMSSITSTKAAGFEKAQKYDQFSPGYVFSSEGEWITDTTDPRLQPIIGLMPSRTLTPRSCQEKYDEVWKAARLSESGSGVATEDGSLSSGVIAAIVCLGVIGALSLIFAIVVLMTSSSRGRGSSSSSSSSRKNQTAPSNGGVDVVDMDVAPPSVEISKDML